MNFTLSLKGFRRFVDETLAFGQATLLIGPNGAGKTTILEALHYLSVGRSHRAMHDHELIGWHASALHATVRFDDSLTVQRSLAEIGGTFARRARQNGVQLPLLRSLGLFHVVLFAPELVELLTGLPRRRRRYLDIVLSATDQRYAEDLSIYAQALKRRNRLLAQRATADATLEPWEAILALRGAALTQARSGFVRYLGELLPKFYRLLTPHDERSAAALEYVPNVADPERYARLLEASRERDRFLRATSIGPHRDELRFLLGKRPVASISSRGEQRSLLLALKAAELEFFTAQRSEVPPLLLLDDMFSELDRARADALTELIGARQTIITATDATTIPPSLRQAVELVNVTAGAPELEVA